ncbi:hypothetical protein CRENBAI_021262 [Crenichthys baileyi]|uniref:Uncharacterized protein n=1 Tax=Crenichthys baileyi TaxID=28760 RepID=A0AAV9RWT2_9TELE
MNASLARITEGHHSTPKTGHPANITPKPRMRPSTPATHTPAWHTPPHQAGWPASPSTIAKSHPNQCRTVPGEDPQLNPGAHPSRQTVHRSQGPRSKNIQAIPREPKHQSRQQSTPKSRAPTAAQTLALTRPESAEDPQHLNPRSHARHPYPSQK